MPRDLFGDVTRPSISVGNRKWYTVPVSLLSHSVIVAIAIVIPLLATDAMPKIFANDPLTVITELVPPPPPPPPRPREVEMMKEPPMSDGPPIVAPTGISPELPKSDPPGPEVPGIVTGVENLDRVLTPPPAPVTPPVQQQPVRPGAGIRAPQKIREVNPVYPSIAQAARIEGIVIIEATIGADGRVVDARVLRSVPMLDQAALTAVRQWEYTPTMLNGVPVPVIMTVTVSFTLRK